MNQAKCSVGIGGLAVLLAWGALLGEISDQDRQRAKEQVEKLYGQQIVRAKTSGDKSDDTQVARTLLDASRKPDQSPAVRAELARTAMEIFACIGGDDTGILAEEALNQYASVGQLSPAERTNATVSLRQIEMKSARPDQRKTATARLADAYVRLSLAQESAGQIDDAAASIIRATELARSAGLNEAVEEYTVENQRIQRIRMFQHDLAEAKQELAAAEAGNNPPLVKAAYEKIGLLHLLRNGDPVSAAEPLSKAEHEWAPQARLVARQAGGGKLSPLEALSAAEMLRDAALKASLDVRAALLEQVLSLCTVAQAGPLTEEQTRQVQQLRNHAQALLEKLPRSNPLRRALLALSGHVQFNADGTVLITYSFGGSTQLGDWTTSGQWAVAGGSAAQKDRGGYLYNNVRFRADRPMQVSLTLSGTGAAAVVLALNDDLNNYSNNVHLTLMTTDNQGWRVSSGGGVDSQGRNEQLRQPVSVTIATDGGSNITWSVNGQVVAKTPVKTLAAGGSLRLGIDARRGGQFSVKNVSLKGTPMGEDPIAKASAAPAGPVMPPERRQNPPRRDPTGRGR